MINRFEGVWEWLVRVFILGTAFVFLCLPILAAAHRHSHAVETADYCEHHEQNDHDHGSETDEDRCPQCEFYSRFVTKQAEVAIPYVFDIPLIATRSVSGWAYSDAPRSAEFDLRTNKDPPQHMLPSLYLG